MTLLEIIFYGSLTFFILLLLLGVLFFVGNWLWEKAERIIN